MICAVLLSVDYTCCLIVLYYVQNPPERIKPIDWIWSDSEPEYDYERDKEAPENIGAPPVKIPR